MTSEPATPAPAVRMPADPSCGNPAVSLAGLIGVLDRADAVAAHQRARVRRAAGRQPDAYRRGAVRRVPLRPVPQAPAARPAPAGALPGDAPARGPAVAPAPRGAPDHGGLHGLVRRVALWGAGPAGEYRAWSDQAPRAAAAPRVPTVHRLPAVPPVPAPRPARAPRPPSRLRRLARRAALWGAGPRGEYLSWPVQAAPPLPRRHADAPVVLREMPSTPTIQPAASSPAAALLPRGPASSAGPRGARPVAPRAVPVPGMRPGGRLERSSATGWPSRSRPTPGLPPRPSPAGTGLVRARGDPFAHPVRGSPPRASPH